MDDDRTLPFRERAYKNYLDDMANLMNVEALLRKKGQSEIEEYNEPLSVEIRKEVTVLLSWGGPADGYKIYFDQDGEAIEGFYFFADWFEYEQFKLSNDELERVLTVYSDISLLL